MEAATVVAMVAATAAEMVAVATAAAAMAEVSAPCRRLCTTPEKFGH